MATVLTILAVIAGLVLFALWFLYPGQVLLGSGAFLILIAIALYLWKDSLDVERPFLYLAIFGCIVLGVPLVALGFDILS